MIACIGDSLHPNLLLELHDAAAGDDGDLAVRDVGEPLEHSLGLWRNDRQCWLLCQEGESSIKVKDDAKLGALVHQGAEVLVEVPHLHLLYVLLCVFVLLLGLQGKTCLG